MTETPSPAAEALIAREHREAIQRLDPPQIRALRRLVRVAASGHTGQDAAKALQAELADEAIDPPAPFSPKLPEWWWGLS